MNVWKKENQRGRVLLKIKLYYQNITLCFQLCVHCNIVFTFPMTLAFALQVNDQYAAEYYMCFMVNMNQLKGNDVNITII